MTNPETFRTLLASSSTLPRAPGLELPSRTRNLCDKVNSFLYKTAHEPSLAGHRIQEHVYKTVPKMADDLLGIIMITNKINGVIFDLDYTSKFLDQLDESIRSSSETREIISELASRISAASSRSDKITAPAGR